MIRFYPTSQGHDAYRGAERIGTVRPRLYGGVEYIDARTGDRMHYGSVARAMVAVRRAYR